MVYEIGYELSEKPKYTVMRGLHKVNTRELKDAGYNAARIVISYTDKLRKQKQTEFIGIEATFGDLEGLVCNIENICNYKSIKGSSEKVLVIKSGTITCNGVEVALRNPIMLYGKSMQFERLCFIAM